MKKSTQKLSHIISITFLWVAMGFFTLGFPVATEARTLTETQVKSIELLLKSYGVDEGTLATVSSILLRAGDYAYSAPASEYVATPATTNTTNLITSGNCLPLINNLYLNLTDSSTNKEVSKLQSFLNMTPTGVFDVETERQVQVWQARNNIVSAGTSDTTGYGYVGPRTREALASCTYTTRSSTAVATPGTAASVAAPQTSQPASPSIVASAYPCTIRGTSCDISFVYSTQNIPGQTVDIIVRRPDATVSGNFYANKPTLGMLSIPALMEGDYTIGIYTAGQNFAPQSLLRNTSVKVTRGYYYENSGTSGEGGGAAEADGPDNGSSGNTDGDPGGPGGHGGGPDSNDGSAAGGSAADGDPGGAGGHGGGPDSL